MKVSKSMRPPSPALVVATIALFVALGGTAGAVVSAAVPLAKRALVADNAKRLGGQTPAQVVSQAASKAAQVPGPASTAAGLVSVKVGRWSLAPDDEADFAVTCDSRQKAIGGGWDDPEGWAHAWDDRPSSDGTSWRVYIAVSSEAPATQSGGLYAVCLRSGPRRGRVQT